MAVKLCGTETATLLQAVVADDAARLWRVLVAASTASYTAPAGDPQTLEPSMQYQTQLRDCAQRSSRNRNHSAAPSSCSSCL
jgi:hypothetical protein